MINNISGKNGLLLLFLLTFLLLPIIANASMMESPDTITVAVTGFTDQEKANCTYLIEHYGGGLFQNLDQYIANSIENSTLGFSNETDLVANETMIIFVERNYAVSGIHTVMANGTTANHKDSEQKEITAG